MDQTALFSLTYGMYILGTEFDSKINACIVNTVSQVTQEPVRVSVNVIKNNYTAELINKSKKFSVSVLSRNASLDTVMNFGYSSGRDRNKFENMSYDTDVQGCPIIRTGCNAVISCKVFETIDLGTHYMFIADVVDCEKTNNDDSMTYGDYRDIKAGKQIDSKSEEKKEMYECSICHYIYDGETSFDELPDDYVCPVCGQPKSVFYKI